MATVYYGRLYVYLPVQGHSGASICRC